MPISGNSHTSLDSKGRFVFPLSLREELGSTFYVTVGPGKFLVAYSQERWNEIAETLSRARSGKSEAVARMLFANAEKRSPDAQGRVVITSGLRDYAGLSQNIVICGVNSRVEIWDEALWMQMSEQSFTPDTLKDAMEELGLYL